jgi:hypothetical protein
LYLALTVARSHEWANRYDPAANARLPALGRKLDYGQVEGADDCDVRLVWRWATGQRHHDALDASAERQPNTIHANLPGGAPSLP